jgi:hypothetical protein
MGTDNPRLGFTQRLDEELKSCSLSKHDPRKATTEDLIRDMHRVLTGNGEFNHGLIFKVAAANTNLGILQEIVTDMSGKLDGQITKCASIQAAHAVEQAGRTTTGKVLRALWDNKALIFVIVLAALVYFGNLTARFGANGTEDKIIKLVDARMEKFIAGGPLPATQPKKP